MGLLILGISVCLAISVILNGYLYYRLRLLKNTPRKDTYEVMDLLQDLMAGQAVVQIKRIAPSDVFLRSPRQVT